MELSVQEVEQILHKKMKSNQLLLWGCVLLAVAIFFLNKSYAHWALIFAVIGAVNLPNINKCKEDIAEYKKSNLIKIEGEIVDAFPEVEGADNWVVFIRSTAGREVMDFIFSRQPELGIGSQVSVQYTKTMKVPVSIEALS